MMTLQLISYSRAPVGKDQVKLWCTICFGLPVLSYRTSVSLSCSKSAFNMKYSNQVSADTLGSLRGFAEVRSGHCI